MKKIPIDFGNWLAGIIAGEGCFRVHMARHGEYYCCMFRLKLRDDDGDVLYEIRRRLGFGHVVPMNGWRGGNAFLAWDCESREACLKLVSVLDRFPLRAKKRRDYAVWRRAVLYWASGVRPRGGSWSKMIAYKKAIENARLYRKPRRRL